MLLRNKINKSNIDDINIKIEAYQKMTNFYEDYLKDNEYEYAQERLNALYNILGEYLVAKTYMEKKSVKNS
tara:strand:+ start:428 stop:640 length:213 start_codon:yes stop_codon:yes gene_type:complete